MRIQTSRRQRPLLKGVPRQWRGMYPAGGASINIKSPFTIWTFYICFQIHTPRLRRTPLNRGLAAAVRLSLTKNTIQDYKCHGNRVETTSVVSNVTAAASPLERGATTVAGYVSRWRSQHKYQKSFYYMDFLYLFYDTYPPASPYPSEEGTRGSSPFISNKEYHTRLQMSW